MWLLAAEFFGELSEFCAVPDLFGGSRAAAASWAGSPDPATDSASALKLPRPRRTFGKLGGDSGRWPLRRTTGARRWLCSGRAAGFPVGGSTPSHVWCGSERTDASLQLGWLQSSRTLCGPSCGLAKTTKPTACGEHGCGGHGSRVVVTPAVLRLSGPHPSVYCGVLLPKSVL